VVAAVIVLSKNQSFTKVRAFSQVDGLNRTESAVQ